MRGRCEGLQIGDLGSCRWPNLPTKKKTGVDWNLIGLIYAIKDAMLKYHYRWVVTCLIKLVRALDEGR